MSKVRICFVLFTRHCGNCELCGTRSCGTGRFCDELHRRDQAVALAVQKIVVY
ncbi:hypothetical protein P692DRAFT_201788315 [Suillus brevipes Sb2]|nr:hypothetical protein P692DRAFT_201788315 [Suillus brevipes Sb2]